MTTPTELGAALNEKKQLIKGLRQELDKLEHEKESWFSKRSEYSQKIRILIQQIKDLRGHRDQLTTEVKDLKSHRDQAHEKVKSVAPKVAIPKPSEQSNPKDRVRSPELIKKDMERLERRIETEAISFDKEKELMKEIRQLRKEYQHAAQVISERKVAREMSHKLHDLGKEAHTYHMQVVKKAEDSQKVHEQILAISKEIDTLKEQEKEAFTQFSSFKQQFNEVNGKLKEALGEAHKVQGGLKDHHEQKEREHKQKKQQSIEQLSAGVEEKIKTKKKLTNADFLIFQKAMKKDE